MKKFFRLIAAAGAAALIGNSSKVSAQQTQLPSVSSISSAESSSAAPTVSPAPTPATPNDPVSERERLLYERIERLEKRLAEVEEGVAEKNAAAVVRQTPVGVGGESVAAGISDAGGMSSVAAAALRPPVSVAANNQDQQNRLPDNTGRTGAADPRQVSDDDRQILDFFKRTTVNFVLDGYYGYNFNRPVGGVNLLRAYDVTSNSFSLKQGGLIIERAPAPEAGQRFGLRLDFQYGQATETVQGNAANEPRPQAYRNLWQAYGTYVAPIGKGLTVDFGKFAGSLGYETNYTKDNFNYSRAYFFNFLPFYHTGFRTTYAFNDKVTLSHWLVNGANQAEDFNGFKSQALLLTYKPTARVTSQFNYYNGQEQRDRNPALNPTFATVASQPGLSTDVIRPVPSGRFHVLDTYHTFNLTDKFTLAVEADYVIGRFRRESDPATVYGGVGYARYQFTDKFAAAARFEYMREKAASFGGLFSGVNQALKEGTLTAEYKFADGFLGRAEYRRDYSNVPFFLTEQTGVLKKEQNTATLGLVFWFGRKQGTW